MRRRADRKAVGQALLPLAPPVVPTTYSSLPVGPFTTVVADPPWQYRDLVHAKRTLGLDSGPGRRGAAGFYPTLSLDQLTDLPVRALASHDAHLYLWTTNAFMGDAWYLAHAWGFEAKTILTWVKPRIGMGSYYRNTTEHVIFAVRGKLRTLRKNCPTHFMAPVRRHSQKPDEFMDIVESMSPGPYVELFARTTRPGWTAWGNEVNRTGEDEA